MKKKIILTNAWMGLIILLAISFQSLDSFGHLVKQFSEKKCYHQIYKNKSVLNHSHSGLEKCFTCEFAFSHSIKPSIKSFFICLNNNYSTPIFYYEEQLILFYKGTSFQLRGPPKTS